MLLKLHECCEVGMRKVSCLTKVGTGICLIVGTSGIPEKHHTSANMAIECQASGLCGGLQAFCGLFSTVICLL